MSQTTKELLIACRSAAQEIAAIERQLQKAGSSGGPRGYGGGIRREVYHDKGKECAISPRMTNNPAAAATQREDAYIVKLESRKAELQDLLSGFEMIVDKLADGTARTILRYYYCVGWTDEAIAVELELSRVAVNEKRRKAVKYLS